MVCFIQREIRVIETCNYICGQHLKKCILPRYHDQKWCECEVRLCHQKESHISAKLAKDLDA